MKNRINLDAIKPLLRTIVKSIEKGVKDDVQDYLANNNRATNNAVKMMRSDCINTNLRDSAIPETVELKLFQRCAWEGCLLIDRVHKYTFSICTKQTLDSIARKPNRHIPHYLQTILYAENSDVEAEFYQIGFQDLDPSLITQFSEEDYRNDYERIMGDDISFDDGYTHLVVMYELGGYEVTYIAVRLLDRNLDMAHEYSLMDLLQPNFGELTQPADVGQEKNDVHNLIKVKAGLQKQEETETEMEPAISVRKEVRENQS